MISDRSEAAQMVYAEIEKHSGLAGDYTSDPATKHQIDILIHHVETFARAMDIERLAPNKIKKILEVTIAAALPNHVQTSQIKVIQDRMAEQLRTTGTVPGDALKRMGWPG